MDTFIWFFGPPQVDVDDVDVTAGRNVKTFDGYMLVIFEDIRIVVFEIFKTKSSCEGQVVGGGFTVICSQPEAADDVISGRNAEIFRDYFGVH